VQIGSRFRISSSVETSLILSIYNLGYAFGPFVFSPASEIYGRVRVIQVANIFYIVWNLACGFAQTKVQLLVFRLLAGIGGSATSGLGGGVLSDVWLPHQRGKGVSVYSLASVLGPAIGPISDILFPYYTESLTDSKQLVASSQNTQPGDGDSGP
jgi:MFS family permease